MSDIIRLRGAAPDLGWPGDALRPLIEQCAELRRHTPDPSPQSADPVERRAAYARFRRWQTALGTARADAARIFGEAQGWTRSKGFSLYRLTPGVRRPRWEESLPRWARDEAEYDHPEYFWKGHGAAGLVVHLYTSRLALDQLPSGIVVDQLPASSYHPDSTTAYVFRPAARAKRGTA